jgi:hypothetical protein
MILPFLKAGARRGLKVQHSSHALREQLDLYRQLFGFSKRKDNNG